MKEQDYLCILMVEDDDRDARMLKRMLADSRHIKFVVTHVTNVDDARRELEEETYDAVLLDYVLGDKTGFDLLERLDRTDLFAPPIIMVTRCDNRMIDLRAQEFGLDDFLVKDEVTVSLLERSIRYGLDRRHHAQQLRWLAFYDQLTELPNRASFYDEMIDRLEAAEGRDVSFPVMMLDMDNFKAVNDTLGHRVGDELLQMVSRRLMTAMHEDDFVARLGGDEFVVVLRPDMSWEEVEARINDIMTSLSDVFPLASEEIHTSVSLGVSIYPEHGTTNSELLKCADLALGEAKEAGRNTWRVFETVPQTA